MQPLREHRSFVEAELNARIEATKAHGSADERDLLGRLADLVRTRSARGWVWFEGSTVPRGFELHEQVPGKGRDVKLLHLTSVDRSGAAWERMIRDFRAPIASDGPMVLCPGGLASIPEADEVRLFERIGFRRFSRWEMKFPDHAEIPSPEPGTRDALRTLVESDTAALALISRRAYSDSIDRWLNCLDADDTLDAERSVAGAFGGNWGPYLSEASFGYLVGDQLVGATMVSDMRGPLILTVMVDPAFQRRGIARQLLIATVTALRGAGTPTPRLNVTGENLPAWQAYHRVGFVPTLGPYWMWGDFATLNVTPPSDRFRVP